MTEVAPEKVRLRRGYVAGGGGVGRQDGSVDIGIFSPNVVLRVSFHRKSSCIGLTS